MGKDSGDEHVNAYGRRLEKWVDRNGYQVAINTEKTFRQQSMIDLTIFKKSHQTPKKSMTDKCGLEHLGQIVKIRAEKPTNTQTKNINWKKVDWKETEQKIKNMAIGNDGGWSEIEKIVDDLPRRQEGVVKSKWWTKEMEQMAKDTKGMRREGNEGWKLSRKVLRNTIINKRFEGMREELEKMKDVDIFKAIKQLEGRRAIPPIRKEDRTKEYDHEKISDMIAEQLNPSENCEKQDNDEIDIGIENDEIDHGLKTSPRNTATGTDKMSYPFVRFWRKVGSERFYEAIKKMTRVGCEEWKKAETVLIRKGDKDTYEVVKSWRMIHLLPVLSKMVDRIILLKLAKTVRLEETQ